MEKIKDINREKEERKDYWIRKKRFDCSKEGTYVCVAECTRVSLV